MRLTVRCFFLSLLLFLPCAQSADYQWRNITVGAGGFAPNIIFSPAEEGLAYLRTDMGGVYRWEKKEQRWIALQDGMVESSYFGVESVAADPNDANTVHAAVGMYKRYPAAMLRSFDRGENWQVVPVPFPMGGNEDGRGMGERLAIDPNNSKILYFGSRHDGLFKSVDQGASWQQVSSFPYAGLGVPTGRNYKTNAGISFVLFDPASKSKGQSQTLFVAIADPVAQHLYRSDDGGQSWQPVAGEPADELRPAQGQIAGENLYLTYANNTGPNGVTGGAVYKLHLKSGKWLDITPGHNDTPNLKGSQPEGGFMGLSVDLQNPLHLVVATMNRWKPRDTIFRSLDGGESWQELGSRSERDVSQTPYLNWDNPEPDFGWWIAGLAINPFHANEVVYTTGATVYRTQNVAASQTLQWKPWTQGIEQTAVITLRSMPEGPAELLSGFGDISGFAHTDFDVSPQVMFTSPVFANTNTIEFAGQNPSWVVRSGTHPHRGEKGDPTLAYSKDYGMSWQPMKVPAMQLEPGKQATRYDLSGDHALIVSADGGTFMFLAPVPLISQDQGKSWHPSKGLPLHARPVADRVNPNRFYALDFERSEIYRSDDGGKSFAPLNTQGLPNKIGKERPTWREDAWPLMASPDQSGHLWYVSPQGLYRSSDGGKQFQRVVSDLVVEAMDFGKAAPGKQQTTLLAIGQRQGQRAIWRSDDGGLNWLKITTQGHEYGTRYRCIAGDLRHFGRVYVGTDGRGIVMGNPVKP